MTLDHDALTEWITQHPGWALSDGVLAKTFRFPAFRDSIVFVNRVATLADAAAHHPDIDVRGDRVKIRLVTHDADGVTEKDTELAHAIDYATSRR